MSESEQYYKALKLQGVETVLVRVPGEPHGIVQRPSHAMSKMTLRDAETPSPRLIPYSLVLFPYVSVCFRRHRAHGEGIVHSLTTAASAAPSRRNDYVAATYAAYHRQLRTFFRRTVDETEVEDLLQELYVRLIRQVDRAPPANCKGFLFSAAVNLLRDRWRRRAVRRLDQMDSLDGFGDLKDAEEHDPSLWTEQIEQLEQFDRALDRVSDKAASAFLWHRVGGCSYVDIAARMGVSVSMVEKYVSSALAELRESRF